ncbi:hypothetical protein [Actinoplanes sp. DH11]|uniref:hypothetical protein n=1 Tax=Actinoplanes sp. DH11 TaxID=2857011 RepID=UPI001E59274E|nr:hypothetical protein [Actinoplanes sp. DH11]
MVASDGSRPGSGGVGGLRSGRFRSRRARLFLALAGGIMGLLCLGGAGIFFILYDDATKVERTEPAAVVDNFLGAYFVDRNDEDANLYVCSSGRSLEAIEEFRRELVDRESATGGSVAVGWRDLVIDDPGDGSKAARVTLTVDGMVNNQPVSNSEHYWELRLVDSDGWRVCGATKVS